MPDHFKIAVKEFRSAIHHLNEAIVKLEHAAAHLFYANDLDTHKIVCEAKSHLVKGLVPGLVKSLEKIIGTQDKN